MVAYFRKQTRRFMLAGVGAALVVSAILWVPLLAKEPPATVAGFVLILAVVGGLIGRLQAARWANRRLEDVTSKLYRDSDPRGFLDAFEPIAADVPHDDVVFADAQTKLSYAWEALGDFDRAAAALEPVRPEAMKGHELQVSAVLLNHRTRVCLMREDLLRAEASLQNMEALEAEADEKSKPLAAQLNACNRLARCWLSFLKGGDVDAEPLRQEAETAQNDIYRAEMELLLGRVSAARGELDDARAHYEAAVACGHGLYAAEQARKRLAAL